MAEDDPQADLVIGMAIETRSHRAARPEVLLQEDSNPVVDSSSMDATTVGRLGT